MSTLIGLICVLCIRATQVVTVSLCNDSKYLEVKEGRDDNRFVCTGLTAQQTVSWYWGTTFILRCTSSSCDTNYFSTYFKISRSLPNESDITVNATSLSDSGSSGITNLTCLVSTDNKDICQLDVIYPAENTKCQVQFSGDTWELTGRCNVSKVRSRRNRYGCSLYNTTLESPPTLVGSYPMSLNKRTEDNYFSGVCEIKSPLPPNGQYNYSLTIIPGEVQVFASFNGNNEIKRPNEPPQHTCPQIVTEGDNVDCQCYSTNLGLPSGVPLWKGTNSRQLQISKVNRTYSGTSNTCNLMWNNTAVQNVVYTITVNFASRVTTFKINNKADNSVNVTENTSVPVVCEAEGRPMPTIRLFKKSGENQDLELALADNIDTLRHDLTAVKCEATANYSCQSNNSVSMHQKYIALFVLCSPKKATNDTYVTTFENGQVILSFQMIAYPPPDLLSIFFMGSANASSSQQVEHKNTVTSTCSSDVYSYVITCAVTLKNETVYAPGFYNVTFGNVQGSVTFTFQVKEKIQTTTELIDNVSEVDKSIGSQTALGAGLGAGLGLACVVVIVLVVINVRQRRMISRQHDDSQGHAYSETVQTALDNNDREHVYGEMSMREVKSQHSYQNLEGLDGEDMSTNKRQTTTDEDASHIYEVPNDEHTGEPSQEDIYENKSFS